MLWIWGFFFLAMALPVSSSDLSGRTSCSLLSHPFRAGQHSFNRASGKSVFPNQEQPFAAHIFQVRIKAHCLSHSRHPLINNCSAISLESACVHKDHVGWVRIWHEDLANDSLGPRSRVAILCYQEHVREACGAESSQFSLKSKQ